MRRIAITGGAGEGKSTVLAYIRGLGHETAGADDFARELFNERATQQLLAGLLDTELPVSADTLRVALGADSELRRAVNTLLHRPIVERMWESRAPFIEVPLLLETCLQGAFQSVWVVTCGPQEQLRRLEARLQNKAQAIKLVEAQLPTQVKLPFADRIVRTNQAENTVQQFVAEAVRLEME